MKTNKIIATYFILFLLGIVMQGFSQGVVNDGGYITGSSTSYIDFSGSGDMLLTGTTADQTTLGNVDVDPTGSGTYKLIIPDSSMITIDGNLTLNDTLLLEANSSSEMASLITNGTITGSYTKVQQYLSSGQYHQVSSPVSNDSSDVYLGIWLLEWSEVDSTWTYISAVDHPLKTTQGFFVWANSNTTAEFEGLLNTGNQAATVTYNNNAGEGHGWNLVGNPYSSAVKWTSSWTKTSITATIYVHNGSNYLTYNYNTGGTGGFNGEIMPTQGFWVKANGSSPTLTIPNTDRLHSSNTFYKSEPVIDNVFSVNIVGNGYENEALIGMSKSATNGFDEEYDAYKLYGIEASPQVFSYDESEEYTVNILEYIEESSIIPLGIKTGAEGEYTFIFDNLDNLDISYNVFLEDVLENKTINLRENHEYTFETTEGLDKERFNIHFTNDLTADENVFAESATQIYSYDNTIYVNYNSTSEGVVEVYDLLGKEVLSKALSINNLNKLKIDNDGYYIVKVHSDTELITKKVYIQ